MKYEKPELIIIDLEISRVITSSPEVGDYEHGDGTSEEDDF